ncbi:MAG: Cell envelope-related transcriptional attenuator, partial [Candidatus Peregrinibacteria bacterium GW2011_GWA2_44_7]
GELKQDNLTLYTQLNANTEAVTAIQENIARLKERVQLVDQSDAFALQSQVETLNNDLNTQSVALKSLINAGLTFSGFSKVEAQESFEVLILGTHGRLTDTVMLASVNAETEKINLVSIPRDLVVGGRRINESFYRFGIDEVRNQIEDVTGLYPEKYVVIDMKSFEDLVDALGGIDVQVKKDLYDSMYPGPNYTYETLNIKAGNHHFDGVTALKYARSRKSTTDFDRAARQQEIIESLKTKILSTNPLTNVDQVIGIYDSLKESVQTDIDLWALISYIRQYSEYEVLGGHVLSTSNYLYPTTGEGGAYLLVPKAGDFSEIQAYVAGVVNGEEVNEDEVQK